MAKRTQKNGSGGVFEGQSQKIALSNIAPNPSKVDRFGNLHLQVTKQEALRESVSESGFWNDPFHVIPNPHKASKAIEHKLLAGKDWCQLWGHNRHAIAVEVLGADAKVDCVVHAVDALGALRLMVEENRDVYGDTVQVGVENTEGAVRMLKTELPRLRTEKILSPLPGTLSRAYDAAAENPYEERSKGEGWPKTTYTVDDIARLTKTSYRTAARYVKALRGMRALGLDASVVGRIGRDSLERLGTVAGLVAEECEQKNRPVTIAIRKRVADWAATSLPSIETKGDRAAAERAHAAAEGTKSEGAKITVPVDGSGRPFKDDSALASALADPDRTVELRDRDRERTAPSADTKFEKKWGSIVAMLVGIADNKDERQKRRDRIARMQADVTAILAGNDPRKVADEDEEDDEEVEEKIAAAAAKASKGKASKASKGKASKAA
jgi:hypothetical protein